MSEEIKHFDEELDLRVSQKFSEDLNILFKPQSSVPPEIDRAVMDRVHQRLNEKHWSHYIWDCNDRNNRAS